MDPVFGALTHHGPLDDDIAVVNGECDAGLVEHKALVTLKQCEGVAGFVHDDALSTGQGRVGGGGDGHRATDPRLIVNVHIIAPPH